MRPDGSASEIIRILGTMPFLDRLEMVAVSGWSRGAVYESVAKLESEGLCASIPHAAEPLSPTTRFHLTAEGLGVLADLEGTTLDELLRSRPVSAQWRRSLLERLDALAAIYRLVSTICSITFPIRFRWYRATPLDAALMLPDGSTVGIIRQGPTADRSAFAKRLWRLRDHPVPGILLVLMADGVRLRHARRVLSRASVHALLALESQAATASSRVPVWEPVDVAAAVDLRSGLARTNPWGRIPVEPEPHRADLPSQLEIKASNGTSADHLLPIILKSAEKRALDFVSDWPWISPKHLAGLMGVSEPRISQTLNPLEGLGLAVRHRNVQGRITLTDRGIALLARRDRTSVGLAKRRWSSATLDQAGPISWQTVVGRVSRQLLRNIQHTDAVHGFLAALTSQASLLTWHIKQLDPPKRASRHFRHDDRMRAVYPDAFGVLGKGGLLWAFFLEWERRAVRPSTMFERLAPYLRYFSSHRPTDDHGHRPNILVVLDDAIAMTHFNRVAREAMQSSRIDLPLWVSHREAIESLGPLGRAWRDPQQPESLRAILPE